MTEVEVWKDVPFNDNYQISSFGQIFSKRRKKILSTSNGGDYPRVRISNKNHKVHRLVWGTFKGEIPDDLVVRHIDGDRTNCRLSNLDIGTKSDNKIDHLKFRDEAGFTDEISHIEGEEWRSSGYDGYEVSNFGRIKSLKRSHEKILKPHNRNGYVGYCLMISSKPITMCAHTLVYDAFIGRIPKGKIVRHLDGDRKNNKVENLALGSHRDNVLDDRKNGIRPVSSTPEIAKQVIELRNQKKTAGQIAEELNISKAAVSNILYNGAWKAGSPTFTGRDAQKAKAMRKFTEEEKKQILELNSQGVSIREIHRITGIHRKQISKFLKSQL